MSAIIVRVEPPDNSPLVRANWDADSLTVSCDIEYTSAPFSDEGRMTLSTELDKQFGIAPPNFVLTGGTFSMALDSRKRIVDWDIFTNPTRWSERPLHFAEATSATLHIDAAFDENGHGDDMGEPEVIYEPRRGTLYLSWGDAIHWYSIGSSLALGVTGENHLAQIRLDGLHVPKPQHLKPRLRDSLRKRFGFGPG